MFRTLHEQDPGVSEYPGVFGDDGEKAGLGGEGAVRTTAGGAGGVWPEGEDGFENESKVESAAAACVLWSTVAVGCLIGGRSKSSVSRPHCYCRGSSIHTVARGDGGHFRA